MHIDWFIVVVAAITIPLAWWGSWLAVKDVGHEPEADASNSGK